MLNFFASLKEKISSSFWVAYLLPAPLSKKGIMEGIIFMGIQASGKSTLCSQGIFLVKWKNDGFFLFLGTTVKTVGEENFL
ncbi:MAG: hypothetical protein AAF960_30275 [Bacteroidota bacterium]